MPSPNTLPPQCKSSGHYEMMQVSGKEAKFLGYDDTLLLDAEGFIAECTISNIFFVKDNKLFTPIADRFLNGITRQVVIELARNSGIEVKEERIAVERLGAFSESFVTGTSSEIRTISAIHSGEKNVIFKQHKITDLLKAKYNALVRK